MTKSKHIRGGETSSIWNLKSKSNNKANSFPVVEFLRENAKRLKDNALGPGAGIGVGCGAGLGFGLVGGVGYGGGSDWNLKLVFGVGMGCGVGLGFGVGQGVGYGYSFESFEEYLESL